MVTLEDVLIQSPLGLVFDIDGTLSPIAPTPDEARLYPGVAELLQRASQHAHVAIMTGRAVDNGAAMINVEGLTYIGSHGLEWSDGLPATHEVRIAPAALSYIESGQQLLNLAREQLKTIPGILVEPKRIGGAIHYRLTTDPERAREAILALLTGPAQRLHMRLSEGKCVVEIKTPLAINKGQALRQLVEHFGLHGVLFAGDDRTDLDAVVEIPRLRAEGVTAISVVVQHHDTLPELLEAADIVVQEVEGMAALVQTIITQL